MAPPQPISMSSQWAPMHSIWGRRLDADGRLSGNTVASSLPHLPGAVASCFHAIERDLVLEGVHGAPESGVPIHSELAPLHELLERTLHQLVAVFDAVEDVVAQHEIATIDHQPLRHAVDACG